MSGLFLSKLFLIVTLWCLDVDPNRVSDCSTVMMECVDRNGKSSVNWCSIDYIETMSME